MSAPDAAPAPAGAIGRQRVFALLGSELGTTFRRWRTIVMLVALMLVPVLIAVAVRLTGAGSRGRGPAFLGDITGNGLFVVFTAITVSIPLFLPLTVGVVAGDSIAGEANAGTLRYLLIAPVGRVRLLAVKFAASCAFVAAAVLAIVVGGVVAGGLLFPLGPVTLLSGDTVGLADAFGRVLLLAGYAAVSLLGLCAIGLFISTLTAMPVGAMAATVVIAGVSQVLDQLPQFDAIHPYLPTHYWLGFADLLRTPIVFDSSGQNLLLQLGYIILFGGFAIARFTTKDILS
ncbi:MAG TPA: ABC transporter permease subunit [Microbacterium sp.]|nr:ABC transporter permease subunit [Microbacterium sp.]HKT57852.1 ABC transporter permease subunit [Microbacterium sp.]